MFSMENHIEGERETYQDMQREYLHGGWWRGWWREGGGNQEGEELHKQKRAGYLYLTKEELNSFVNIYWKYTDLNGAQKHSFSLHFPCPIPLMLAVGSLFCLACTKCYCSLSYQQLSDLSKQLYGLDCFRLLLLFTMEAELPTLPFHLLSHIQYFRPIYHTAYVLSFIQGISHNIATV